MSVTGGRRSVRPGWVSICLSRVGGSRSVQGWESVRHVWEEVRGRGYHESPRMAPPHPTEGGGGGGGAHRAPRPGLAELPPPPSPPPRSLRASAGPVPGKRRRSAQWPSARSASTSRRPCVLFPARSTPSSTISAPRRPAIARAGALRPPLPLPPSGQSRPPSSSPPPPHPRRAALGGGRAQRRRDPPGRRGGCEARKRGSAPRPPYPS